MSKYTCPACHRGFDKAVKSHCPLCGEKLKYVSEKKKGEPGFNRYYILPEDIDDKKTKELDEPEEVLISTPNQQPEIYRIGKPEEKRFRVVYTDRVHLDWVYCPNCQRRMFQNMTVGGHFTQVHKCRQSDCKAIVEFQFKLSTQHFGSF